MAVSDINLDKELPFVSIIVLNYNGKRFLYQCLSAIFQISYPSSNFELIFVDNASTDGSAGYVSEKFPTVKIVALDKNYGFTEGNNIGANFARGDLIVFLNNDTVVHGDWLIELVKTIDLDPRIGVCGSKIISMENQDVVQYSGRCLHILGDVIPNPSVNFKSDLGTEFPVVGSVQGASFLIRKNVFKSLLGFDSSYFLYSDEVDICYRTWISGYYVTYAPKSIVYHYGGGGSVRNVDQYLSGILNERLKSPLRIYYGNRNSITNVLKNFAMPNAIIGYCFSLLYFNVQLIGLLKVHDIKNTKLLFCAYLWHFKNIKIVWKKRLIVQANRKISDHELIQKKILLSLSGLIRRMKTEVLR